ncbi:MAG: peptidase T [bacterium]|nr:peptidase T [bacterium]
MKKFTNPQEILDNTSLVQDFIELTKINTASDENATTCPSSKGQLEALSLLKEKLIHLGLDDATIDEKGFLFATLPTNQTKAKTIGLLAHIDTSPEFSGENVNPQFHENYNGETISLKNDITISPDDYPELKKCVGDTVITTDGTTLLGADDKAGIAVILTALKILQHNSDIPRPTLRIAITPDEELGTGVQHFDIEKFNADCAYTLDGSFEGYLCFETFSADKAIVTITGLNTHPGYAKDKMVSALRHAGKFIAALPQKENPEHTDDYEGFYHPTHIEGGVSEAKISFILRDFDDEKLANRTRVMNEVKEQILKEEPRLKIDVNIQRQYRNMKNHIMKSPEVIEKARQSMKVTGITPVERPIRGGTDGSTLSEKGLPTPNIFAGSMAYHGPKEWISTRVMGLSVCNILNLLQLWTE